MIATLGHLHSHSALEPRQSLKPAWLELEYVDERTDGRRSWIVVSLNCNGRLINGTSPAIDQKHARHGIHRAALATLNALELFSDHLLECSLLDVASMVTNGQSAVHVRLHLKSEGSTSDVFGSAPVEGEFAESAARAVLDAANLFVHSLLVEA